MLDPSIISIGLGLFVGILLAITGAGGTILSLPLLVFSLNLSMVNAAPIVLLAVMFSASVATVIGLREGIVRYKAASLLATCGVVLAPVGVW
ncbi:MAG: TSUP family transporter, partial [Methylotenera sp.]